MQAIEYAYLIPLLPLIGAVLAGFFGKTVFKGNSHWPIWLGVLGAAVLSFMMLFGMIGEVNRLGEAFKPVTRTLFTWIQSGNFTVNAGFFFDPLTVVMLCVVTGIGLLITIFAAGYMKGEEGYYRFFAYLGLFIFMMTVLVMGDNLVMLYLGWEGVGLCSYLLVGYHYDKPAAREAAKKAFLVNRVGDLGFALGIMLVFTAFGTVTYFGTEAAPGFLEMIASGNLTPFQQTALDWIPFLLMIGAFGKSAQFPLYVWLPDAMEGPTPVSALIHAATMVTAGVYMIVRCSTVFVGNDAAMLTIAIVGAFTAIFAATIALRQNDLKKVFAYSTVSQLGFMFVGVAVLAPVAGVFHLITHAFFKALLFLGSGVVMHAMAGELDLRKMSGLKAVLPKTRILMLIGCAALAGFPLLSGFWSKDEIIAAAGYQSSWLNLVLLTTAFLTAYYTFRLYFRVFEGPLVLPEGVHHDAHGHGHQGGGEGASGDRSSLASSHQSSASHPASNHAHNHEPAILILPLIVLAIGALLAGYLNFPKAALGEFLGHSPSFALGFDVASKAHTGDHAVSAHAFGQPESGVVGEGHALVLAISAAVALLGIALAYVLHLKDRPAADRLAGGLKPLVKVLEAKYWVDEIFQNAIVEPLRAVGRMFAAFDNWVVDGVIKVLTGIPKMSGVILKITTQRGYLQGYATAMLFGIVIILMLIFS